MNKLIALALALSALAAIATPTFAQSYDPSVGTGNIVPGPQGGFQSGTLPGPLYNYAPLSAPHHYRTHHARRR